MENLPKKIKSRKPQNARLGIKSSLSNIKRVVSLTYLLYVANDRKAVIDYSEEYSDGTNTKLRVKEPYKTFVTSLIASTDADSIISANPLLSSQIEHLQVGLELVLQLGKVLFTGSHANSSERTGGNRYAKSITFSRNIIYLDVFLSALTESDKNSLLVAWLKNEVSTTGKDDALCQMLTAFTEDLKMSVDNGTENRTFQQEGLYEELLDGNNVVGKDAHEDVGPLRIYKSFVREGLHPYVSFASNEFSLRGSEDSLKEYLTIVSTTLDMHNSEIPDMVVTEEEDNDLTNALQKILYGCPGTGKSHKINKDYAGIDGELATYFDEDGNKIDMPDTKESRMATPSNIFRTTFHPDYDYSNFVGSYKPVMRKLDAAADGDDEKRELEYAFVPQVFTKAYMRAYKSKNDDTLTVAEKQVYLIIEEINRGNCAQIFGDLFQLLDRKNGVSEYPVIPDTELINYLNEHGIPGNSIRLPENLHILATMNTSDQSLFPMDSAFKRRWAMEYIPINLEQEKAKTFTFKVKDIEYSWVEFLAKVNPLIRKATDSEDKQMGEFFIKDSVSEEDFKNKVMFYIWNDVCKDLYSASRISPLFFMRSAEGDDRKDVFTFAELFGAGRHNEESDNFTSPKDLLEGFITKRLKLTPKTSPAPTAE